MTQINYIGTNIHVRTSGSVVFPFFFQKSPYMYLKWAICPLLNEQNVQMAIIPMSLLPTYDKSENMCHANCCFYGSYKITLLCASLWFTIMLKLTSVEQGRSTKCILGSENKINTNYYPGKKNQISKYLVLNKKDCI